MSDLHFRCKCGRMATIVDPNTSDSPTLLHEWPPCKHFNNANTPEAMLQLARESLGLPKHGPS